MMWNNGNGRHMYEHDGAGWLMVVLMLVIAVAVVIAVVALLRGSVTTGKAPRTATGGEVPDARGILRERFARGDIDEEDFRARMRALDDTDT
jgi:putative membrane protein